MTVQTQQQFDRIPGTGWLFYRGPRADVKSKAEAKRGINHQFHIFDGWLAISTTKQLQARVVSSTRTKSWHVALHEFPETTGTPSEAWAKVGEFTMPGMGDLNYTQGKFIYNKREYIVRAFVDSEGNVRFKLPQVLRTPRLAIV